MTGLSDLPVGQGPVHIRLLMGSRLVEPVPAEVAEALLSAQITATAGERSGFQLAFDLTKNGLISRRLLPQGSFDPKTRIVVTVSVRGTSAVLFDGLVVRHEVGASNQPGHSTLTVTGEDLTLLMDLEERTAAYPNLPPSRRVLEILRRYSGYGIRPDVYDEQIPQPPHQDTRVHYQTQTDLQYVTELARANGYTFYLEPGPGVGESSARWGPEHRVGERQHALSVNMDANSTVDQLTFAYDGTAREEPQARWQDPATRKSELLDPPPIDPLRPPLGKRPHPGAAAQDASGHRQAPARAGGGRAPRPRRHVRRRRLRLRFARRPALRLHPAAAPARRRTGLGAHVRRRLLRQVRHAQPASRLVPAELHPLPRGTGGPQRRRPAVARGPQPVDHTHRRSPRTDPPPQEHLPWRHRATATSASSAAGSRATRTHWASAASP
ncbi:hypothetical protein M2169_001136 [Streptomyces sp. MJP52]|nr:hypothetical protein [Streptomyces sp. MJP52]